MFTIIDGGLAERVERKKQLRELRTNKYKEMFISNLYHYNNNSDVRKAVYCGIKYIANTSPKRITDYAELILYFCDIQDIRAAMIKLTYRDFISIFPISKEYNGKKYGFKDYFSVMYYLKNKNLDDYIKIDDIDELLWEYLNSDIMMFLVNEMSCVSSLNVLSGGQSLLDSFLDTVDKEHKIHTYTYHEKECYMYDRVTGKTFKVKKCNNVKNKHLKLIK